MTNLHVLDESEAVCHQHIAPALEEHHGNRPSRKHVPNNEFSDNVEASLLTGDSLNDT